MSIICLSASSDSRVDVHDDTAKPDPYQDIVPKYLLPGTSVERGRVGNPARWRLQPLRPSQSRWRVYAYSRTEGKNAPSIERRVNTPISQIYMKGGNLFTSWAHPSDILRFED